MPVRVDPIRRLAVERHVGDLTVPPGGNVKTVARSGTARLAVGADGTIAAASHLDGWSDWPIAGLTAAPGAPVTAVSRDGQSLDALRRRVERLDTHTAWRGSEAERGDCGLARSGHAGRNLRRRGLRDPDRRLGSPRRRWRLTGRAHGRRLMLDRTQEGLNGMPAEASRELICEAAEIVLPSTSWSVTTEEAQEENCDPAR